jgi:hypothetical protein
MSGFEPGPGWREVDPEDAGHIDLAAMDPETGRVARAWVRAEPTPSLPTAPGYYVGVTGGVYRLDVGDDEPVWDDTFGNPQDVEDLTRELPLDRLEPRAVTAKAVLDRVRYWTGQLGGSQALIEVVAREFGVGS